VTAIHSAPLTRVEGREKVQGHAKYAFEHQPEHVAYAWIVQSEIARGTVRAVHGPGTVLWHANTPRLETVDDHELEVLQSPRVAYRGQIVAAVVADSLEAAREAAGLVQVTYDAEPHDVELIEDHP
jgi:xanthine dehydrogenase YagR molybdenum-binding subunit